MIDKSKLTAEYSEHERKFLINHMPLDIGNYKVLNIQQGYLLAKNGQQVRVRIIENDLESKVIAKLAIKIDFDSTRFEYETSIPLADAKDLLDLCTWKLEKTRYTTKISGDDNYTIDIDDYGEGKIVAELEGEHIKELKNLPNFLGEEVTNNKSYSNVKIAKENSEKSTSISNRVQ